MRIVFAGNPEPAVLTLQELQKHHTIVAVITSPARAQGRGQKVAHSKVAEFALQQKLPLIETANINTDERVEALEYDLGVVVAFGQRIGERLLGKTKWMNVHYSLLPRWRGAAPVQYALMYGDDVTGVSTFFLEKELDAGPLIAQATYTPTVDETATTLLHELSHIGASLASHSLEIIEQEVVNTRAQESAEITYAPKIEPADLVLQWNQSAIALERKVRALLDKPLAFTTFRGKRIQIGRLRISDQVLDAAPGTLISEGEDLYVATGSVLVQLTTVKPEGKSWMDASAWWRGIQDRENANFT